LTVELQEYDFVAKYLPGKDNTVTDYLYRYILYESSADGGVEDSINNYIYDKLDYFDSENPNELCVIRTGFQYTCGRYLLKRLCKQYYKQGGICDGFNKNILPNTTLYHRNNRMHERCRYYCCKCIEDNKINPIITYKNRSSDEEKIKYSELDNIINNYNQDNDIDTQKKLFETKVKIKDNIIKNIYKDEDIAFESRKIKQKMDPIAKEILLSTDSAQRVHDSYLKHLPYYIITNLDHYSYNTSTKLLDYDNKIYMLVDLKISIIYHIHKKQENHIGGVKCARQWKINTIGLI